MEINHGNDLQIFQKIMEIMEKYTTGADKQVQYELRTLIVTLRKQHITATQYK